MKFVRPILLITLLLFFPHNLKSDETKKLPSEHEYNFYSGLFDFSDKGKKSTIIGLQHQNENIKNFLHIINFFFIFSKSFFS